MQTLTIQTPVHGRSLYVSRDESRLLVGFHGYGEDAAANLEQVSAIPGIDAWSVAAVQALHPFYTRSGAVVASWMTSLDRELAISDNLEYVLNVLAAIPPPETLVFAGFSQGAAMAARAAAHISPCAGLILVGGDIPPEIKADATLTLPPTLLARGIRDDWYTEAKFKEDLSFLESRTRSTACEYDGGHEWTDEVRAAAGRFLAGLTDAPA
jgi:predicted esterase